jgi:hypothetical protein
MKCAILENLSTTTKIESLPFLDIGKPKTKAIKISTQGAQGTGKGVYNPRAKTLDLACLHVTHLAQTHSTSRFIFSQKKNVHATPLNSSLHQNDPSNHVLHAQSLFSLNKYPSSL